jgi:hypothetical protein
MCWSITCNGGTGTKVGIRYLPTNQVYPRSTAYCIYCIHRLLAFKTSFNMQGEVNIDESLEICFEKVDRALDIMRTRSFSN